jgi:hypothetical protein
VASFGGKKIAHKMAVNSRAECKRSWKSKKKKEVIVVRIMCQLNQCTTMF